MSSIDVVIDRIEGSTAILEVGEVLVDWPLGALPGGAAEGQVWTVSFTGPKSETEGTSEAEARLERLRARGPSGGAIDL